MSEPTQNLHGVVIAAQGIDENGDYTDYKRFIVELEPGNDTVDVRVAGQRKDVIWMVPLADLEEALRTLKKWARP